MPGATKDFGLKDSNFPWRERRLKKWSVGKMKTWLNEFFQPTNQGGHLLIDMVARLELERFLLEGEYLNCINPKERRRLFESLMKLDSRLLTYLRAAGVLKRGRVLLRLRSESESSDEPSELAKLIKFRPQPQLDQRSKQGRPNAE